MLIKKSTTNFKDVGPMGIHEYKINPQFSGALIEIDGDHGKIKCLAEDRIYFILEGQGKFFVGDEEYDVELEDLIYVERNTSYNIIGKMRFFMSCSPEFNAEDDMWYE